MSVMIIIVLVFIRYFVVVTDWYSNCFHTFQWIKRHSLEYKTWTSTV